MPGRHKLGSLFVVAAAVLLVLLPATAWAKAGDIFVVDQTAFGGSVIRVDPATGAQSPLASGGSFIEPSSIVFDSQGQLLVVDTEAFGGTTGGVIRVDPVTGAQTPLASGAPFANPSGIALDLQGRILVTDAFALGGSAIIAVDPVTGTQTPVA